MLQPFEQRVGQIDREKNCEEQKNFAVMVKKINLPIVDRFGLVLIWKKERRDQIEDGWREDQPDF